MIRAHAVQQEFLRCNACSEDYDEEIHIPRVLPCLHTHCQVCIRKLSTTNIIICPNCRTKNRLPTTGVRGLPIDTTRRNLCEFIKLRKTDSCITCKDCPEDNEASGFCKDCNIYLCLDCKETHKRSIATRSHEILKIENMKVFAGSEVFRRRLKCTKSGHEGQLLAFYCSKKECRAPLCKVCIERDHKTSEGHVVQNIEEVQQLKMTELKRVFCHLGDMVTFTRTIVEQLEQEILNIDIREFEMEKELESTFTECQRMLEKRKDDLKAEISKICKRQRVVLVSKSEKMGNFIDTVGSFQGIYLHILVLPNS
ncbi:E3 ubiquitin-protein ligase TRIM56 [Mizuhopecten yessoensis]|uniref:E3 ubiquitin-protein ligase TRIM56 n=1 Tax=Mizuhopecten yessoensis TaxID=6573 RepID=A0A210R6W4_MIZYE|nr:E3 ubiquitin-protein ligase TRIM56 [Mizuhopecten yessoensis]